MRILDTRAYLDQVCDLLAGGSTCVPVPVAGNSMCPFLQDGDMVYLDRLTRPVRRGDVVLFTRPGGRYVLHRILGSAGNDLFWLLGDNQMQPEIVPGHRIHGIASAARRRGKQVTPKSPVWRFYAGPWLTLRRCRRKIAGLGNRLGGR